MRKARQKVQKKPFGMCERTLTFVWQLKKNTYALWNKCDVKMAEFLTEQVWSIKDLLHKCGTNEGNFVFRSG